VKAPGYLGHVAAARLEAGRAEGAGREIAHEDVQPVAILDAIGRERRERAALPPRPPVPALVTAS
jgi:hypothetical protein